MKLDFKEPICAQITPPGRAAIHVIRISGEGCIQLVARHFSNGSKLVQAPPTSVVYGVFKDAQGVELDEVLISVFRTPHSYTGDDTLEISCHGNPGLAARIMLTLLDFSRMAEPGEFTLRALHNNKIDLIQAEAVNDLIQGDSSKARFAALSQVRGVLSKKMQELLQHITNLRIHCELAIDFADQDLPSIDENELIAELDMIEAQITDLIQQGSHGRLIRDGIRICLAGAPNAGKSSLFNELLKENRAIVSPHPGTTRDYLEETLSIQGYTVVLTDTAGLRESGDETELEGIERSRRLMQQADLILYLADASDQRTVTKESLDLPPELAARSLIALSKADLASSEKLAEMKTAFDGHTAVACSVLHPGGLDDLTQAVLQHFSLIEPMFERPLVTNTRHLAALEKAGQSLAKARHALANKMGFEFAAFDLIEASAALEQILGVIAPDELLDQIFSGFCIGK